jgi:hypothetical protein
MTTPPPPSTPPGAPVASIDDLLGFGEDDEPAAEEVRRRSPVGRWARDVGLVVLATAVVLGGLRIADIEVNPFVVLAAFTALRMLHHFVGEVAAPPPVPVRRRRGDEEGAYRFQATDGLRAAVRRWEQQLTWSQSDAGRFSRNVLPVLAELTDERLRLKHGITRASDPQRAHELLGDAMWRFLADPDQRPPKARDLTAYVEVLEKL